MVDSQSSGLNSSKSQLQRRIGKVESAKIIRTRQLKELAEHVKKCAATDVVVIGDFNESIRSENMKRFVSDTRLCNSLTEVNGVDVEKGKRLFSTAANAQIVC